MRHFSRRTTSALCFGQQKVQSLCISPMHTTKTTSSNCKIPLGACFINTSHSSTGLPTEDYGELLECHLCVPDQRGASTVAKHGEQKDQLRLDTCIPNTRGWCPIRKQMKPSCLVQEQRKGQQSQKLGPVDSLLANQELLDLWSTRLPAVSFQHYTVCWAPWAYIRDKYRLNLTATITFTICSVLGCWQCCGGSQMSSCRGGTGLHAVVRCCRLAVCHRSCDMSKANHAANRDVYGSIKKKKTTTFYQTSTLKHACENGNLVHVEPSEDWLSVSFQACLVMPCQTSYSTRSLMSRNPPWIHMHAPRGMQANTYTCTSICTSAQRGCPMCAVLPSLR